MNVLVVDDKEENLYYLKVLLEAQGWVVRTARHGAEALTVARSTSPDLVVSDLLMPVMDGYTLLRHWKLDPRLQHSPFVVYTATYTERQDEQLALDMGADAFILKPCEPADFLARIHRALDTASQNSPRRPQPTVLRDEEAHLKHYSETLIRKLEEKTLQLEESNRALEQDIVERKRIEAQLRLASQIARVGGWSCELPVKRLQWSDELCALRGVEPGTSPTLEGLAAHFDPASCEALQHAIEACAHTGTAFDLELRAIAADGRHFWVHVIGQAERDAQGQIVRVQGMTQDIDHSRKLQDQLTQAQKLEAIGRLASGVAHDFNNMLSVILSYTTLLTRELTPNSQTYADVAEIHRAGLRATDLTRQLLAFSRQQVMKPDVVDVAEIIAEMEPMLQRLIGEDVTLSVVRGAALGKVLADRSQVQQIFMNLAVNARDAMPHGGRITIETANVEVQDGSADHHEGVAVGSFVRVALTDTGTGMDESTRERIFEPFFTTKAPGKGTGLGLATVIGIVQQSHGHITVRTELGRGTTFAVYLPRTIHEPRAAPLSVQPPTTLRGSESIVLVEDDDQVRTVAADILRRHGYRVVDARNGGEAILICEKEPGVVDLLVTDVVMPLMGGPELAQRLIATRPNLRVLYMSGYTESAIAHDGVPAPGIALVPKPITPDALCRKVREVLDAHLGEQTRSTPAASC